MKFVKCVADIVTKNGKTEAEYLIPLRTVDGIEFLMEGGQPTNRLILSAGCDSHISAAIPEYSISSIASALEWVIEEI